MQKPQPIHYVASQLTISAMSLRNEIERLQDLETCCRDEHAKRRINHDWNQLEGKLDRLLDYTLGKLSEYGKAVESWSARALAEEPTYQELRPLRARANGSAAQSSHHAAQG